MGNNLHRLPASTFQRLHIVKKFSSTASTEARTCQVDSVSTLTICTHRQISQVVQYSPEDFSMDYFSTPPNYFPASVPPTTYGVDRTNIPHLQVTEDHMAEISLRLESFLDISDTIKDCESHLSLHSTDWPMRIIWYFNLFSKYPTSPSRTVTNPRQLSWKTCSTYLVGDYRPRHSHQLDGLPFIITHGSPNIVVITAARFL